MMEDRIVCKTNTSKEQLEGFMELLEKQINDRIGVEKNLKEVQTVQTILQDSHAENVKIIRDLKEKLADLRNKPRQTVSMQTLETSRTIDNHIRLAKTVFDKYSDVYSILKKSLDDVNMEKAFDFEPHTLRNIYQEQAANLLDESSDTKDSGDFKVTKSSLVQNNPSEQAAKVPEKKSFMSDIFKKITNGLGDNKLVGNFLGDPETPITALNNSKSSGNLSGGSRIEEPDSEKLAKVWQKEIFNLLDNEVPFKKLESKVISLIVSGNSPPAHLRGRLWGKALGNRSRINKRLFKLLYAQLDQSSPAVKESIIKDMDRTYSDFKGSETFRYVRSESIKILQLWEMYRPDIGFIQGMSYIAVLLRLNMSTYHAFKCFCNLVYTSDILFSNYCFDTKRINTYYTIFNHLVSRSFPEKFDVMKSADIHPSIFMVEWFYTLFARQFSFDLLFRFWDLLFIQGEIMLFRLVLLIFSRTEFKNRQPADILNGMKRLDKVLGPDFYRRLGNEVFPVDEYYLLLQAYDKSTTD